MNQKAAFLNPDLRLPKDAEIPPSLKKYRDLKVAEFLKKTYEREIRLKSELSDIKKCRDGILNELDLTPETRYFTDYNGEWLVFYKISYQQVDSDKLKKSTYYKRILKCNLERADVSSLIQIQLPAVEYYLRQYPNSSLKLEDVCSDVEFYRVSTVKEIV